MAKQPQNASNANANTAPNPAPVDAKFSGWKEEKTGFAPYWQPTDGASFTGIPTDVDDTGKFIRILFTATEDTECFQGPVESQEKVVVHKGETFTISIYEGLRKLFGEYFNAGFPVEIHVTALEKIETSSGNDFWRYSVKVEPECAKRLDEGRMQRNADKLKNLQIKGALPASKSA